MSTTTLIVDDGDLLDMDENNKTIYENGTVRKQVKLLDGNNLNQWLSENNHNRRQLLVSGPSLYEKVNDALSLMAANSRPLKDVANVRGFSYSLNKLLDIGAIISKPGATGRADMNDMPLPNKNDWEKATPLFFQRQARVNKPVDYKQIRNDTDLGCRIDEDVIQQLNLSEKINKNKVINGVWVTQAIDRFPLVFFADGQKESWIGTSKYMHLSSKESLDWNGNEEDFGPVLAALLTCTPVLLWLERYLKEGTRKTLRVNENGYAKEITRSILENVKIPNLKNFDKKTIEKIVQLQKQRGKVHLDRMDKVVENTSWIELDNVIGNKMGIKQHEMNQYRHLMMSLYWRRMRNVKKFGEYY